MKGPDRDPADRQEEQGNQPIDTRATAGNPECQDPRHHPVFQRLMAFQSCFLEYVPGGKHDGNPDIENDGLISQILGTFEDEDGKNLSEFLGRILSGQISIDVLQELSDNDNQLLRCVIVTRTAGLMAKIKGQYAAADAAAKQTAEGQSSAADGVQLPGNRACQEFINKIISKENEDGTARDAIISVKSLLNTEDPLLMELMLARGYTETQMTEIMADDGTGDSEVRQARVTVCLQLQNLSGRPAGADAAGPGAAAESNAGVQLPVIPQIVAAFESEPPDSKGRLAMAPPARTSGGPESGFAPGKSPNIASPPPPVPRLLSVPPGTETEQGDLWQPNGGDNSQRFSSVEPGQSSFWAVDTDQGEPESSGDGGGPFASVEPPESSLWPVEKPLKSRRGGTIMGIPGSDRSPESRRGGPIVRVSTVAVEVNRMGNAGAPSSDPPGSNDKRESRTLMWGLKSPAGGSTGSGAPLPGTSAQGYREGDSGEDAEPLFEELGNEDVLEVLDDDRDLLLVDGTEGRPPEAPHAPPAPTRGRQAPEATSVPERGQQVAPSVPPRRPSVAPRNLTRLEPLIAAGQGSAAQAAQPGATLVLPQQTVDSEESRDLVARYGKLYRRTRPGVLRSLSVFLSGKKKKKKAIVDRDRAQAGTVIIAQMLEEGVISFGCIEDREMVSEEQHAEILETMKIRKRLNGRFWADRSLAKGVKGLPARLFLSENEIYLINQELKTLLDDNTSMETVLECKTRLVARQLFAQVMGGIEPRAGIEQLDEIFAQGQINFADLTFLQYDSAQKVEEGYKQAKAELTLDDQKAAKTAEAEKRKREAQKNYLRSEVEKRIRIMGQIARIYDSVALAQSASRLDILVLLADVWNDTEVHQAMAGDQIAIQELVMPKPHKPDARISGRYEERNYQAIWDSFRATAEGLARKAANAILQGNDCNYNLLIIRKAIEAGIVDGHSLNFSQLEQHVERLKKAAKYREFLQESLASRFDELDYLERFSIESITDEVEREALVFVLNNISASKLQSIAESLLAEKDISYMKIVAGKIIAATQVDLGWVFQNYEDAEKRKALFDNQT